MQEKMHSFVKIVSFHKNYAVCLFNLQMERRIYPHRIIFYKFLLTNEKPVHIIFYTRRKNYRSNWKQPQRGEQLWRSDRRLRPMSRWRGCWRRPSGRTARSCCTIWTARSIPSSMWKTRPSPAGKSARASTSSSVRSSSRMS